MSFLKQDWHIEPTTKCKLACPRCPRTTGKGSYPILDLSVDLVRRQFTPWVLEQVERFVLCGTYGDPIFHAQFHELLKTFKSFAHPILLNTSGSGQSPEWWEKTGVLLTAQDNVVFSIDGLEDTSHLYRRNSSWTSIVRALETMVASGAQVDWKFIYFKHNQDQVEDIKRFAADLGVKNLYLIKSNRFGQIYSGSAHSSADELLPRAELLSKHYDEWRSSDERQVMAPKCHYPDKYDYLIRGLYISAEGYFSPCCWTERRNPFGGPFDEEFYDLKLNSLEAILRSAKLSETVASFDDFATAPKVCRRFCAHRRSADDRPFSARTNEVEKVMLNG
jgi:MoaA/NifB/PqqE/SkfB family radical SAM enzyme